MMEQEKAKVFLSCGQRREGNELGELELAQKIKTTLEPNFDVFVAALENGNQPMLEQILKQIKASDYFLFVDFKRNKSKEKGAISLFAHQELAVAHHLQIPRLVFREEGLDPAQGMSGTWLDNAQTFKRENLAQSVHETVSNPKNNWIPEHRNRLIWGEPKRHDINDQGLPKWYKDRKMTDTNAIHYHIPVYNASYFRDALNCLAYVYYGNGDALKSLEQNNRPYDMIPGLKWEGSIERTIHLPKAIKMPERDLIYKPNLVSVMIMTSEPHIGYLVTIGDHGEYQTPFFQKTNSEKQETFDLVYTITSSNFEPAQIEYQLTLGDKPDDFTLKRKSHKPLTYETKVVYWA